MGLGVSAGSLNSEIQAAGIYWEPTMCLAAKNATENAKWFLQARGTVGVGNLGQALRADSSEKRDRHQWSG